MDTKLEMVAEIVAAHARTTPMTKEELLAEISDIHGALSSLGSGDEVAGAGAEEEPAVSRKTAFGKEKVACMICGKEMKTLGRHLRSAHDMKPNDYRKRFDIPRTQPLAARSYSESRRQMAKDRGLGENLAKGRAAKSKKKKK